MIMRCAACGRIILGAYFKNDTGQTWCMAHQDWPSCRFCGAPTQRTFTDIPRCAYCERTGIDDFPAAQASFHKVRRILVKRGMKVDAPVKVIMRNLETWTKSGHWPSYSCAGVTFSMRTAQGDLHGRITIGLVAGYPESLFESNVAHEWTHASLASRGAADLAPVVEEGFAEYVSYRYLLNDCGRSDAAMYAKRIETRPEVDDYGRGFRLVRDAVGRHGMRAVSRAVRCGSPASVGLPSVG